MASNFNRFAVVTLRGLAQVAFADRLVAGVFVLTAIALLSPWGAVGAVIGAVIGTATGRLKDSLDEADWEAGLGAPNPAIVGIFWGNAFAIDEAGLGLLVLAVLGCIGLERVFRPALRFFRLPVLAAPAMVTVYLVDASYSIAGGSFWQFSQALPFGDVSVLVAVLLIVAALLTQSRIATLQIAILVPAAALASAWIFNAGLVGSVGLWGFTVAPAAFAMHAVFLAGSAVGGWAGLLAAALGGVIWSVWVISPLPPIAPPLLCPFILAVWASMGFVRRWRGSMVFEPRLWQVVEGIRRARSEGKSVVALTGAGISTASGIPDYVSGSWLHPGVPVSTYSFERFLASRQCRLEYWNVCYEFRQLAEEALPNPAHGALARLERCGWLETTITQNVDGLHQDAGACSVIELHGQISRVNCLNCGWTGDWPPESIWRGYDLHCQDCSGVLKPAVIAMGEQIAPAVWSEAENAAETCGVMIVVGSQMAVSSAAELLSKARQGGAKVIVISLGPVVQALEPDDIVIEHKAEEILPALAVLLDCPPTSMPSGR